MPDLDDISGGETRAIHFAAVHDGAQRAALVADDCPLAGDLNDGMFARDAAILEDEQILAGAADGDQMMVKQQLKSRIFP